MLKSDAKLMLRELGDGIGHPFCVFDQTETLVYCNDAFERALGVRGLRGITLAAGFEATEYISLVPAVRACLRGENPEVRTISVDGFPVRYYQSIVKPILRDEKVALAVCTLADITEKMDSLQFANKARQFYNRVFDEMPQAYFMLDDEYAVLRANRSALAIFGYTPQELLGYNLANLLTFKREYEHINPLEEFLGSDEPRLHLDDSYEISGIRRDGSVFPARVSIIRSDLAEFTTYSAIFIDLTAERERERRGIEREKKTQGMMRNEALGQLAGKFAHDMNNVLAVIGGFCEILSIAPREDDRSSLDEIMLAVKRAASLTTRILAYTGRQQMEIRPLNLNRFLAQNEFLWRDTLGENIKLKHVESDDLIIGLVDERQLAQVLLNLLSNCRDAVGETGKTTIGLRKTSLSDAFFRNNGIDQVGKDFAEIYVMDNGVGIPRDKQQAIFEPYFSTKDPNRSSGLGLAIVYGIMKQHGGFIFCESVPGEGTTMRLFLPLAETEHDLPELPATVREVRPENHAILLVDDEEQLLQILKTALTKAGFRVYTAKDGREAQEFLLAHTADIDLLISDVMMPHISGIELAQWTLENFPGMRILFVTGFSSQIIHKYPGLRHFHIIHKPFSPKEVVEAATNEISHAANYRFDDAKDYSLPE